MVRMPSCFQDSAASDECRRQEHSSTACLPVVKGSARTYHRTIPEGSLKKTISLLIAALFLWGCSSSHPSITTANVSDSSPVTGQMVLFQVVSLSDNPPMTYTWQADSGVLAPALDGEGNPIGFYEYWTAPDEPGETTVTCTVTDEDDKTQTHVFTIQVKSRVLEPLHEGDPVLSMEKQSDTQIAGVWVSTQGEEVRYITSASDQVATWSGAFGTMHIGYDDYNLTLTLWGAPPEGNEISVQSDTTSTLVCPDFGPDNKINDLIIDVIDSALLFLGVEGTEPGVYYYSSSSVAWGKMKSDTAYQFFPGRDYTYAATSAGIYELGKSGGDLLYSGDSTAVLEVVGDDKTTADTVEDDSTETVWHVTRDTEDSWKVWRNGSILSTQPDEVAGTLDVDLQGMIWCGKYRWDGSAWWTPPDPENYLDETVKKTVASTEGRIYFLTESGALLLW